MKITFEPLCESDFTRLLYWLKSSQVSSWWDQDIEYDIDLVKEKFEPYTKGYKMIKGDNKPIYSFIISYDSKPIGYIQYYNAYDFPRDGYELANLPKSLAALDMFIGEQEYIGKSIGQSILKLFLKKYINTQFKYVIVDPAIDNIRAIKNYEKLEFKKLLEYKKSNKVLMLWKKSANWKLYYDFEKIVHKEQDNEINKILDKFDMYDFLSMPIVIDLVCYKKISLLKSLHKKNIPLTYEQHCGGNALHVACGLGGSLEYVKFFVENGILKDINKKSIRYGDTALTLAISYAHKDIINYFKNKFFIKSVSLEDVEVIIDRVKVNCFKGLYNDENNPEITD